VSAQPAQAVGDVYEVAARQAAVTVRGYSSIVVVADNPSHAARAAIGIATAEAGHRRVVIGDLTGESPEIQALVKDDDPHGIHDTFAFGTSFGRVIRQVGSEGNLNVALSGTESAATEEIIGSERWQRIASGFAQADELLILVAASTAPRLAQLVTRIDGVVLVGKTIIPHAPNVNVLARIPEPTVAHPPALLDENEELVERPALYRRPAILMSAVALLALVVVSALLLLRRPSANEEPVVAGPPDSIADSAPPRPVVAQLPANPADSADAAAYSVEILAANTAEGANFELQRHGAMMPAATISAVPIGETEAIWYKVYAGAFTDSAAAEQLLRSLRRRGVVPDSAGAVVRAPLALRVDSVPPQGGVGARTREKLQGYSAKGLAIYALRQSDGSARLYSGAFATPAQSSLAATALRVAGLTPVLEYRTGRVQ